MQFYLTSKGFYISGTGKEILGKLNRLNKNYLTLGELICREFGNNYQR